MSWTIRGRAFDTIHEALIITGVYKYIIAGLLNPLAILDENPELAIQILSAAMISMPTQGFLVYRIYVFSGKNIVAPILWAIQMIYQFVAAFLYVAKSFYTTNGTTNVVGLTALNDTFFTDITISCLALAAVVDVLIAIAMTYLLLQKRNATGFRNSAHILQRLTMFAVNTGIWTATFAVMSVILMRALPSTNLVYLVFAIPLASLYCNTLLANLNARTYIRGEATTLRDDVATELTIMSSPSSGNTKVGNQSRETKPEVVSSTQMNIRKTTEVVTFMDADRVTTPENSV
ncbi:hypothetical protein OG21DRAFT_1484163 [Imleria badia]|nr:hypothetical protein OG21DRAFT_1484163 [Imleria badia]